MAELPKKAIKKAMRAKRPAFVIRLVRGEKRLRRDAQVLNRARDGRKLGVLRGGSGLG